MAEQLSFESCAAIGWKAYNTLTPPLVIQVPDLSDGIPADAIAPGRAKPSACTEYNRLGVAGNLCEYYGGNYR